MSIIFETITKQKQVSTLTKHEQIVNGITHAIESGDLKKGDQLPSINVMVAEIGYARKTIVKAYEELKGRGIVESKNFKGYYIADTNTKTKLRVALVLYALQSFQEDFYNTFREELGENYVINVFFHHNNIEVFKDIMRRIRGRYGMYVVAPIQVPDVNALLKKIPSEKLLVIDRYLTLPKQYSYIAQEFEQSTYQQLETLLPKIKKYQKFILFYQKNSDNPVGIYNAFNEFVTNNNIEAEVHTKYAPNSIQKRTLYFFISDLYLWEILRDCKEQNFKIGADIGILAHNDNAIKEIIFGGITTISTNFKVMAKESAEYVRNGNLVQKIIPSQLIKRDSI